MTQLASKLAASQGGGGQPPYPGGPGAGAPQQGGQQGGGYVSCVHESFLGIISDCRSSQGNNSIKPIQVDLRSKVVRLLR